MGVNTTSSLALTMNVMPQTYYVDLSERLLNIRSDLLERNKK